MATETVNEKCDFFEWRGYTLTTSGHYTDTIPGMATECDKVYHLELDLDYSPKPKISCNTQNATVFGDTVAVITNTEFFSFQYDFYVEDTLNHIDDWEYWEWHISQPSWLIEPFEKEDGKHYCRVYVAERCDEYIELSCTVYNHCDQDSTTNSFYLKSSFYGIDENETIPSDFNIAPNPNNGTMELNFENLIGKTDLKVFDMHGALIDQLQVNSESSSYSIPYQCKSLAEGLYFFVATWQNTVLTKKVIILQ